MWRSSLVACIATKQIGHDFGGSGFGWFMPGYDCHVYRSVNYGCLPNARPTMFSSMFLIDFNSHFKVRTVAVQAANSMRLGSRIESEHRFRQLPTINFKNSEPST
jgi:hypothetical protein